MKGLHHGSLTGQDITCCDSPAPGLYSLFVSLQHCLLPVLERHLHSNCLLGVMHCHKIFLLLIKLREEKKL